MIERVCQEAPKQTSVHKEAVKTIASGVVSLKTQLVNMANKNKKMWRAVAKSGVSDNAASSSLSHKHELEGESIPPGRYNLRSTPTRLSAANRNKKQTLTANALSAETQASCGSNGEDDGDSMAPCAQTVSKTDTCTSQEEVSERTDNKEPLNSESLESTKSSTTELVTVPLTELEKAKQMAQQLTTLIASLEDTGQSELSTSAECV